MAAGFDEPIVRQVRSHACGHLVLGLFADFVADVQAGKVAHRQRAHRHAELVERGIDVLHLGPLFDEECRLPHVGAEHPIADKPPAIADEHADLAELLGDRHRGCQHLFDDCLPRTISKSFITLAGLKKWLPTTICGRLVEPAI